MDILLSVPHLPGHDEKVLGELVGKLPGGMGGNVACAASQMGLHAGMVSWVGDDADGRQILNNLKEFGVDTTHLITQPNTLTNYTTILLDSSGEKAIIIVPTSFDTLTFTPDLTAYLSSARLVYCTAFDLEQLARVASVVHAANHLLCTDIEPVAGLQDDSLRRVLELVDIAFIDAGPFEADRYDETARDLQAMGPQLVVMGLGAAGALACQAGHIERCAAFKVPVIDTTGAGDCFTAAFLAAFLRQLPLPAALKYGCAAAALSIQAHGARGALPTHAQVQAFLAQTS